MCLGELGQVQHVSGDGMAEVRVGDRVRTVALLTLDGPVMPGDFVLIHSGFVLSRLTADEAHEAQQIRTTATEEPL